MSESSSCGRAWLATAGGAAAISVPTAALVLSQDTAMWIAAVALVAIIAVCWVLHGRERSDNFRAIVEAFRRKW